MSEPGKRVVRYSGLSPNGMEGRMAKPILTLAERFWSKVEPEPNTGCFLWSAVLNNKGYGMFHCVIAGKRRSLLAHRVAWELERGPIPNGLWCLHKCDVRHCVSVDHMFLGNRLDNVADMVSKERGCNGAQYGSSPSRSGRFRASVTFLGRQHHLGTYDTADEASSAAKAFKQQVYKVSER